MIPTSITAALSDLSTNFNIADPLDSAGTAAITALQNQAKSLAKAIDTSNLAISALVDGFTQPTDSALLPSALLDLQQNLVDQGNLSQMRGFIGRVAYNLNQVES